MIKDRDLIAFRWYWYCLFLPHACADTVGVGDGQRARPGIVVALTKVAAAELSFSLSSIQAEAGSAQPERLTSSYSWGNMWS